MKRKIKRKKVGGNRGVGNITVGRKVLRLFLEGKISHGRAAEMLKVSIAEFMEILEETKIPQPEALNKSIIKEIKLS